MNYELLKSALENPNNLNFVDYSFDNIHKSKNDILQKLNYDSNTLKFINKKLKKFIYIENYNDITPGSYIKWINISNSNDLSLKNGGYFCNFKNTEEPENTIAVIKLFNNTYISIYLNHNLIFKKITQQEDIILKALKLLNKS
tara:strand:- start:360 stop:788 length:429 start_codon:yes stop_codon:yes gene_type:complete